MGRKASISEAGKANGDRIPPFEMAQILKISEQELVALTKNSILRRSIEKRNGRMRIVYDWRETVSAYITHLTEPERRAREEYVLERRDTARIVRAQKELELAFARGELINRAQAIRKMQNAVAITKNNLLGLPTRCSRQVIGQTDYHKVHAILRSACLLALREMVNFDMNSLGESGKNGENAGALERRIKRKSEERDRSRRRRSISS